MTRSRLRAVIGNIERELTVGDDGLVTIAGAAHEVHAIGQGVWRVSAGAHSVLVHVAPDEHGYWVHVDGRVHRVEIVHAGAEPRRQTGAREHALAAPMPATVLSVVAPVGQAVRAGDPVLMLEAMKMELPIRAPRDGVVTAIHCREGQLVRPGVTLVEIT